MRRFRRLFEVSTGVETRASCQSKQGPRSTAEPGAGTMQRDGTMTAFGSTKPNDAPFLLCFAVCFLLSWLIILGIL